MTKILESITPSMLFDFVAYVSAYELFSMPSNQKWQWKLGDRTEWWDGGTRRRTESIITPKYDGKIHRVLCFFFVLFAVSIASFFDLEIVFAWPVALLELELKIYLVSMAMTGWIWPVRIASLDANCIASKISKIVARYRTIVILQIVSRNVVHIIDLSHSAHSDISDVFAAIFAMWFMWNITPNNTSSNTSKICICYEINSTISTNRMNVFFYSCFSEHTYMILIKLFNIDI